MDRAKPVSEMTHEEEIEFGRRQRQGAAEYQLLDLAVGEPSEEMLDLVRSQIAGEISVEELIKTLAVRFGIGFDSKDVFPGPEDGAGGHVSLMSAVLHQDYLMFSK